MKSARTIALPVLILFLVTVSLIGCTKTFSGKNQPKAVKGLLDLRDWDFEKDGPVTLNGEWEFYWQKLFNPKVFANIHAQKTGYIYLPRLWNDYIVDGKELTSIGYATFRITIKLSACDEVLGLHISDINTASEVWLEEKPVSMVGVVGKDITNSKVYIKSKTAFFKPEGESLQLIIKASNFKDRDGGIGKPITLGTGVQITSLKEKRMAAELVVFGILFIMSIYHYSLFYIRKIEISNFYFGTFCFLFAIKTIFEGEKFFLILFPDFDFQIYLKLWFFFIYISPPIFLAFLHSVYSEFNIIFVRIFLGIGLFFSALVFLFPFEVYVQSLNFYLLSLLPFFLLCLAYILLAVARKRDGAIVVLAGFIVLTLVAANDIMYGLRIHEWAVLNSEFNIQFGFIIFVFSQSYMISLRFSRAFSKVEYMSKELKSKNESLKMLDQLKDEFLANTSHELRTPLNGIIGLAESLKDGVAGNLGNLANRNLSLIVSSGKRLASLVNDILDFQKLRNRDIALSQKPVDLRSLADVVLAVSVPLLRGKPLELRNEVHEGIPPVRGDENRIQQILHNLVGNAIKFTPKGIVAVTAAERNGMIEIFVTDTGPGISADKQESIFESFEQADASIEREYGGTGLGLSITRQLVELHGGTIHLESEPGRGATFSFTLPVSNERPVNEEGAQIAAHFVDREEFADCAGDTVQTAIDAGVGRKALVVDDEPVNRQTLHNLLGMRDYRIIEAADGETAMELVESEKPDIVLLDIMMPRMSGYEVCRKIRESYPLAELPVIMLTAKNRLDDLVAGFQNGANDYLSKPFSKEELLARVRTLTELRVAFTETLRLNAKLVEQEKMATVGNMAASIVHDFKNPVGIIKGYVELADDDDTGRDERREYLKVIEQEADRMASMAQDLLDFSRGSVSINKREIDISIYLERVRKSIAPNFTEKGIKCKIESSHAGVAHLDPDRFLRVFINIAGNAADALESGGNFDLNASRRNGRLVFELKDDGPGIPKEIRDTLFEPFVTLGKLSGTGLGMAITKSIVEAHGGSIRFETGNEGTTFFVELPVSE